MTTCQSTHASLLLEDSTHTNRAHSELSTALGAFQQILTADQTAQLRTFSSPAPTPDDVVRLTEQITEANATRKSRLFAKRLQGFLSSIQQYSNIIDTCVGPNQIAALVWGGIKLVLLVCATFVPTCLRLCLPFTRPRQTLLSTLTNYRH
jgi:hypothetical protein